MATITLFAQPYDISAAGFYFETIEQYGESAAKARNDFGQSVEEFEIQLIDADALDCALAQAWELNQANLGAFLEAADDWDIDEKRRYIIAVGECGYDHAQVADEPGTTEVDLYAVDSLRELAEQFVDEGLYGDIPESLHNYIDFDTIARDLAVDFSEITIAI